MIARPQFQFRKLEVVTASGTNLAVPKVIGRRGEELEDVSHIGSATALALDSTPVASP